MRNGNYFNSKIEELTNQSGNFLFVQKEEVTNKNGNLFLHFYQTLQTIDYRRYFLFTLLSHNIDIGRHMPNELRNLEKKRKSCNFQSTQNVQL